MKKFVRITVVLALMCATQISFGQRWFKASELEFGLIVGFSHYSGDLTQSYFEARGMKPSVGIITRYTPNQTVTFRLSGQFGGMEGDDNWYTPEEDEIPRQLHFRSRLWDFTAAAEWNLIAIDPRRSSGVTPYLFGGISVFKYNPESQFIFDASSPHMTRPNSSYANLADRDGQWVELQPLATEGQETTEFNERKRYNLTQLAIPIGGGFKFKLNNKWAVGLEYGLRFTFTDYLDDVSTTYVEPTRIEAQYGPMAAAMADRSPTLHLEGDPRG